MYWMPSKRSLVRGCDQSPPKLGGDWRHANRGILSCWTVMIDNKENPDTYWFARHSKSIIFLIVILAMIGIYEAFELPVAVFPTTNFPLIVIGVDNGVMPIEQMEVTITRPIEQAINSVPGLESVRSVTSRGSAEVDLLFNWNVNMIQTLQMVDAAVSRIQSSLPATAKIETHRMDFSSFPIIGYSLTSDKIPQTDLWELATYDIKPRLNRLTGVANVLVQGGQQPEFQITVDPSKMLRTHVSVGDILAAINHTNIVDSPGLMSRNHQLFLGLVNGQVHNADDISAVVVKNVNNVPVRVGDIGTVGSSVAPVYTSVTANGKPAVLLSINRQPDSNTVEVADLVHSEMEAIRPSLPAGIDVKPFYDQSNIVNESIKSVRDAIIIGLLLAGLVIWLFLRDWGTAVMTGLGRAGDDVCDVHRNEARRPEFQPDDIGRPGGGSRTRHRRQDRRRRKYRVAPRCGAGPVGGYGQRLEGTDRSSDRVDADANRRLSAADHHYGRDGYFLQRACDRHERCAVDVAGSRACLDKQSRDPPDPAPWSPSRRDRLTASLAASSGFMSGGCAVHSSIRCFLECFVFS